SYDKAPSLDTLASAQLLRYRMPALRGGETEANSLLFLPKGQAPAGGWPLLVWAHGTVGVADDCAPSRRFQESPERSMVEALLKAGYAVLAPDYEGLDAPGAHPYLSLDSQGRAIIAAVEAAHELKSLSLSRAWAVMGHSQGGFAALAAAEHAPSIAARYPLRITLALAPAADLPATLAELVERVRDLEARLLAGDASVTEVLVETAYSLAFNGTMLAHGLQAQDPGLKPSLMLHESFVPLAELALRDSDCGAFEQALQTALVQHVQAGGRLSEFRSVKPDAFEQPALRVTVARNLPGRQRLPGPVLYLQGSEDEQTPVKAARVQAARMQALGTALQYLEVPGATHSGVVESQLDTLLSVLRQHHR
ncbi:alpha/beta fold hydrolase, partial [Roseateles sp.]|uniref:alpha/beta fold hydrolase n=1 Tax=Roseateles sp. TaxID=1971397 RepID=UPI00391DE4DD